MKNKYIHYGHDKFDINLFEPIKNRTMFSKPYGGFWASGKHYDYPWSKWCEDEEYTYKNQSLFFEFKLLENSKILKIDNFKQLKTLPCQEHPLFKKYKDIFIDNIFIPIYLDFEKLSIDYDVIEVLISKDYENLHFSLYGWDCDSILIMNPNIIMED